MRVVLPFIRLWLPVLVVVAGVILYALDPSQNAEGAGGIVGAGICIWLLNFFFRIGVSGDRDRQKEEAARAYFDRHGHWPDQAPHPPPAEADEPAPAPGPAPRHRPTPHRRRPE